MEHMVMEPAAELVYLAFILGAAAWFFFGRGAGGRDE